MRPIEQSKSSVPDAQPNVAGGALSRALTQGLNLPLSALRASMEGLTHELARSHVGALRIDGVLREVERLGKNVRELVDFASPPVPRPLRCSLEEIVSAARSHLAPELRASVMAARCEPGDAIHVDGPLLSSCLWRLIENALEAGSEHVLVVARLADGQASFSVFDDAPGGFAPDWKPVAFQTTKPNHLGLGLTLTERDVALLSGRLEFLSTPSGETCVRIMIPQRPPDEESR